MTIRKTTWCAIGLLLALPASLLGVGPCSGPPTDNPPQDPPPRPWLMVRPEHKALILSRIDREPYAMILAQIEERAAQEYQQDSPDEWDSSPNGQNGMTAQANALLAWLLDDEGYALKARDFFDRLRTDFDTNTVIDVNIRMGRPLMGYTNAWDILQATDFFPEAEAAAAGDKICEINRQFYRRYVDDDVLRTLLLGAAQNNHPLRTAAAIGYVGLAFPDHPQSTEWLTWAVSEMDYLWSEGGHYVQADGGVSEGPFYYNFGFGISVAFLIAFDNLYEESPELERDCSNRVIIDPWSDHGCVEGEPFTFDNPLYEPYFIAAVDWNLALRLPFGPRPPLGDANYVAFNGSALLSGFGADGRYRWDWEGNRDRPYEMGWGADLTAHHLVYFDDAVEAVEPPWTTRFFPEGGNAVFRSDWSDDARWGLLVAEHGSARKTLHDHVDGTSFTMAAYGEYLLIDTGYYKPDPSDNAKTAHSPSHNLVLIDGIAAPDKGLLTNFRDADAWLRNTYDGDRVECAEAHQQYQDATVVRSVVFVDSRYFVLGDRIETAVTELRMHTFRLHGHAGYDVGGLFELRGDGARFERPLAGVDVYVSTTVGATALAVGEPPFVELRPPHVHQFNWSRDSEHHGVMDATVLATEPDFLSLMLPYRVGTGVPADEQPIGATSVDLGPGATAWTIHHAGTVDLALVRESDSPSSFTLPTGEVLDTDGLFVVLRLVGPNPFAVLSRGTYLDLDGASRATAANADGVTVIED